MVISLLFCLFAVSCGKDYPMPATGDSEAEIGICLRFGSSKSSVAGGEVEQIRNVCIGVFDENDNLELFSRMTAEEIDEGLSTQLSVTVGPKTVHAVANVSEALAENLAKASGKAEFLSAATILDRDNVVTADGTFLLMHGSIDGNDSVIEVAPAGPEGMTSCSVLLERLVSKVCLYRIVNSISEPLIWKEAGIAVTAIFLMDANVWDCIGEGLCLQPSYADWKGISLLGDSVADCNLAYGKSYDKTPFTYYTYSGNGGKVTYLCLETVLSKGEARKKCYYSIPIEDIERNRLYNIKSITIKSAGTDNPGERHSYDYVSVDLEDDIWDDGENTFLEY